MFTPGPSARCSLGVTDTIHTKLVCFWDLHGRHVEPHAFLGGKGDVTRIDAL